MTTGSATFARFSIQPFLEYEFDEKDVPANWTSGAGYWYRFMDHITTLHFSDIVFRSLKTGGPGVYPPYRAWYGTEVFKLNTNLANRAFKIVKDAEPTLEDAPVAQAWRSKYKQAAARAPPTVVQCDGATSDQYYKVLLLS